MPKNQEPLNITKRCFVCGDLFENSEMSYNKKVNLPVCYKCKGQPEEILKEKEHLDCMGDGFTVGCIS